MINEKLKFTFGHIVAFVSLIYISYVTFMGVIYWSDGSFLAAGMATAAVFFVLLGLLVLVQELKGTKRQFKKSFAKELITLMAMIVVCFVSFIPYSHFWTIHSQSNDIVFNFKKAVLSSVDLFDSYESYANKRIVALADYIDEVKTHKSEHQTVYEQMGLGHDSTNVQRTLLLNTLKLQLLSPDYKRLSSSAKTWMDDADRGASVWNVFLLGNLKEIGSSFEYWHSKLTDISSVKLSYEIAKGDVRPFDSDQKGLDEAIRTLNKVSNTYTTFRAPGITSIITGLIAFLLLFFPYFLQERNTKSFFSLTGQKESVSAVSQRKRKDGKKKTSKPAIVDDGTFTLD